MKKTNVYRLSKHLQTTDGLSSLDGKLIGTYFHHLFHNDRWRNFWLNEIRMTKNLPLKEIEAVLSYEQKKEETYAALGRNVNT
ncbi:hypothetical protein KHA80_01755 [Anaerobacillus sp. HL2]|nr:hypothetical protein KHA80_01755 [Anaerobacillus sp. HL2]